MGDFIKLEVWQRAHKLAIRIYRLTQHFPRAEDWALTSQLRRSAISIPSNVAEGCGRNADSEMRRFLKIALGSAFELHYQLLLARDLTYLPAPQANEAIEEILRIRGMLYSLTQRLNARRAKPSSVDSL
jgi:four helix bundle protein